MIPRITLSIPLAFVCLLVAAPTFAQEEGDRDGMEEFEEVDPYTEGDPEKLAALGYEALGQFLWRSPDLTTDVHQNMGAPPMLWVETQHFKIGSSLNTYPIPNDKIERAKLKEELKRIKEKLGRMKIPKRRLDPWIRLHLYAQRAEDVYAKFQEQFGLQEEDWSEKGPYLGHPEKGLIIVTQRSSEFGRYVRHYHDTENEYSWRWSWPEGGFFWGGNVEVIQRGFQDAEEEPPYDSMLHGAMVAGLSAILCDSYDQNLYGVPRWLGFALGHVNVRDIDARWVTSTGRRADEPWQEDDYLWEARVSNLVKNEFFATTEQMFGWNDYQDMNKRDHMIAWSRLKYLLTVAEGNPRGWLNDLAVRPDFGASEEAKKQALVERQRKALLDHFALTPEQLDEEWAKWVKKTFKKR